MEFADILADDSPLFYVLQWIMLTGCFLVLTFFFRNHIEVEGFAGFILILFVIMPINIAAKDYLQYVEMPVSVRLLPLAYGFMLLVINLILFFAITLLLPGLSASSNLVIALFALLFTTVSVLLRFLPTMFQDMFALE